MAEKQVKRYREKPPEEDFVTQNRALKKIIKALNPKKDKRLKSTNNPKKE